MSLRELLRICLAALALTTLAVGCGPLDDEGEDDIAAGESESVGESADALLGGRATYALPAIGILYFNGKMCTASLIRPDVGITAAHCFDWMNVHSTQEWQGASFTIQRNATSKFSYPVRDNLVLGRPGNDRQPGSDDIAVFRLARPVSSIIAIPMVLRTSTPGWGTNVQIYGYGCTNRDTHAGVGTKRVVDHVQGTPLTVLCPGDSGGPMIVKGTRQIFAINSGYNANMFFSLDFFGDVPGNYARIEDLISQLR
jgi:secreted trypsin-like serine protease